MAVDAPPTSLFPSPYEPIESHSHILSKALEIESQLPEYMGGPAHVELLYSLAAANRAQTVVETGVASGWSSLAFLLHLHSCDGQLYSTDRPYPGNWDASRVGAIVPEDLRQHWDLHRIPDRIALPRILKNLENVDLAHYDSDKSYHGRLRAYGQMWTALRPGGLLVSDDVGDNMAFAHFASKTGAEACVLAFDSSQLPIAASTQPKYVGILQKGER